MPDDYYLDGLEERLDWLLDQLLATNADHPYRQQRILLQARDRQYVNQYKAEELMKKHHIYTLEKGG